ncbi:MAG: ATP-binding protein [Bacteroidota bacterium]
MIKQSDLIAVIDSQKVRLESSEDDLERDLLKTLPSNLAKHALIISGIRRCGKSTILGQMIKSGIEDSFFINFDTPKLYNFELSDFEILDLIISEKGSRRLFFDELQVVDGWELYVRQKLDEGYQVFVTGSNASLLSHELGTRLTGRHITKELFPFSFQEFANYQHLEPDKDALLKYLALGGFPEFIKHNNTDILTTLLEDILYRDIAIRYNIRDVKSLKRLLLFLVANVGNLVTATKLTQSLGIKSSATILDYFSFFEQSYLLNLMPKFSYSYRAQLVNPRKIYVIDNGLINAVSPTFSNDYERKLENIIYWSLRQQNKELFYFNETGSECDFVVCRNNDVGELIQVCYELTIENTAREQKGLIDAMTFFKKDKGIIITLNQSDEIRHEGKQIRVLPAYKYLTER